MSQIFKKIKKIYGNNLIFKNATVDDAQFILELRTNPRISRFLSKTSSKLSDQESWLQKYESDDDQMYFIILNKSHEKIGTVRLYDKINDSFCWGSWILKEGVPSSSAIESSLMVYELALSMGFKKAHFDVRKGNRSVWSFHERLGAVKIGETGDDFLYTISNEAIKSSLKKYRKYLPEKIKICNE